MKTQCVMNVKVRWHYSGCEIPPVLELLVADQMSSVQQSTLMSATFLTSASGLADSPRDQVPEVAFVGRSNVGKSSVLNCVAGARKLARTSKTPGRTQLFNYFDVDAGGRLVDLPGYGYAKVPLRVSAAWRKRISSYLAKRTQLRGLVLVMDARHPFRETDISMMRECSQAELPLLALLNKSDKLSKSASIRCLQKNQEKLALLGYGADDLINFSAHTGEGAQFLRKWIRERLTG